MNTTALVQDIPRAFVIGIGSGLGEMAARLGRTSGLPRFDLQLALGTESAAARSRFAYQLDSAVRDANRSVVLMGAGAACSAIAWWARLSPRQYTSRIAGALFFAPEDGDPVAAHGFASPRERLGFPSIVVDGLAARPSASAVATLATAWGSDIRPSGIGIEALPGGSTSWGWIGRTVRGWTASVVEHDVRLAASLAGGRGQD